MNPAEFQLNSGRYINGGSLVPGFFLATRDSNVHGVGQDVQVQSIESARSVSGSDGCNLSSNSIAEISSATKIAYGPVFSAHG